MSAPRGRTGRAASAARKWSVRASVTAAAFAVACHHSKPASAPIPTPAGAPPTVQTPVAASPIDEPVAAASGGTLDPQLRRFDVVAVGDSTFIILVGGERWVRRGVTGFAVDPRRRDALVARFRVVSRAGDSATALITGQTTRLEPTHVALIRQPVPGLLSQDSFWTGLFLGLAAGVAAALLAKN